MAHMHESSMVVGKAAWHNLAKVVPEGVITANEVLTLAGMDWLAEKQELFATIGKDASGNPINIPVADFRAMVRSTDKKVLGVVGKGYVPVQNHDSLNVLDTVVAAGNAQYATAGSLDGGRKVYITAKLPGTMKITGEPGDEIEKYVAITNSHDGSGACRMMLTPIRIVCMNTFNAAIRSRGTDSIAIRHTTNAVNRMQEAARAINLASEMYGELEENLKLLAATKFSEDDMLKLVMELFPAKDESDVPARTMGNRAELFGLFESGKGITGKICGTKYAAYNAVTEFVDWSRSTRTEAGKDAKEVKAESILFGSGAAMKAKAFQYLTA